jgi:hypothetical protein
VRPFGLRRSASVDRLFAANYNNCSLALTIPEQGLRDSAFSWVFPHGMIVALTLPTRFNSISEREKVDHDQEILTG